ncbi:MAG: winged helix-turn-helix domain-containing protein [Colwellia sp.]|nr:winged helix-turn-helix domain-containing protein [Colwellia sp.]
MQYQIGPWLFLPARCVISSGGIEKELDPLTFKLINYFISQPDRIIPRQELVENVWLQSFVDDNAINRAISELRKQLSHKDHKAPIIKTHYRKGYSLTVAAKEVIENPTSTALAQPISLPADREQVYQAEVSKVISTESFNGVHAANKQSINEQSINDSNKENTQIRNNAFKKVSAYKWLLILVVLLLLINIVMDLLPSSEIDNENSYSTSTFLPKPTVDHSDKKTAPLLAKDVSIITTTWNIGSETQPLVSPDKILFSYTNNNNGISSTFIKNLSSHKEVKLLYKDLHISAMSWQPLSRVLLTEVTDLKSECYYATFNLTNIDDIPAPTLIKKCDKQVQMMAQLGANGNVMYHIELDEKKLGREIYQYNIQTQKSSVLIPSGNAQYGVVSMLISPNGKQLLYRWYERNSPVKVYLFDLETREQRVIYEQSEEFSSISLAWLPDSQHIAALKGKILQFINVETSEIKAIELPITTQFNKIDFIDNNQFLSSSANSSLYQVAQVDNIFSELEPKVKILYASDSYDYYPIRSKKNKQINYFVSSRTNQNQIWQVDNGKKEQISHFEQNENINLYILVLSDNEDYLLFSRNSKLEFIDLTTGVLHKIPELDQAKATSYVWSSNDKSIIYSSIKDKVSQIWQFDLLTRSNKQLTFAGGQKLLKNEQGDIFYINDNQLLSLNYEKSNNLEATYNKTITIPVAQCWCSIALAGEYFYSLSDPLSLSRMHLLTEKEQTTILPRTINGTAVSANPNNMLTTLITEKNTQIQRVFWSEISLP